MSTWPQSHRPSHEEPGPLWPPEGPLPRPDHRQQPRPPPIASNRLAEAPRATAPNQIWVADITYIPTAEGWLYLAGVLDLHSRKIVGWAMSPTIDSALVLAALAMATLHRTPPPGLLFHTARGVQYVAGNFRAALKEAGLVASMSRRGNCYDNASVERFWSTLKLELVYRGRFTSRTHAKSEIFDFIEVFYNRPRHHTTLSRLHPTHWCRTFRPPHAELLTRPSHRRPARRTAPTPSAPPTSARNLEFTPIPWWLIAKFNLAIRLSRSSTPSPVNTTESSWFIPK